MKYNLVLDINYDCVLYMKLKENMMCQNSNGGFNNRIKFKFN